MTHTTTDTRTLAPAPKATGHGRSRRSREESAEARAAKVAELHATITTAVEDLASTVDWVAMLRAAARFHRYSFGNQLLIAAQCPHATQVAGFRTWQALGRQVRKGEKGIAILAPVHLRPTTDTTTTATDAASTPTDPDADQSSGKGSGSRVLFRPAFVFDLSQTDGDPLPALPEPVPLSGPAPAGVLELLTGHVTGLGFTVQVQGRGPAEGHTDFTRREVVARADRDGAHTVVTLAHELAHIALHDPASGFAYAACRGQAEIEAESVAFIVATALGVAAAAPGSADYIAGWARGDIAKVRATAERVTTTAAALLAALVPDDADPAPAAAG